MKGEDKGGRGGAVSVRGRRRARGVAVGGKSERGAGSAPRQLPSPTTAHCLSLSRLGFSRAGPAPTEEDPAKVSELPAWRGQSPGTIAPSAG